MKLTQTRAADTLALGIFETKTLDVPVPGAPEVLYKGGPYGMNGITSRPRPMGDCGCGCKGAGTCGTLGSVPVLDEIANALTPVFGDKTTYVVFGGLGIAALLLLKKMRKGRR
jgi:hypothetical protein